MTRRTKQAIVAVVVLLEVAFVVFVTGMPVRWTQGVVLPEACQRMADAYACQVEIVSDGTRVTAKSDRAIAPGNQVALLAWRDLLSGEDSYSIVD
jgi:hypothetical protein